MGSETKRKPPDMLPTQRKRVLEMGEDEKLSDLLPALHKGRRRARGGAETGTRMTSGVQGLPRGERPKEARLVQFGREMFEEGR